MFRRDLRTAGVSHPVPKSWFAVLGAAMGWETTASSSYSSIDPAVRLSASHATTVMTTRDSPA